ncbi:DUF4340 domain-containing protein [Patescibacteria group bacterium]|nr:DUF4340 domain-containing protein [Patescibacteria group bacterium]
MDKKTLRLGGILIILIVLAYLYQGPLKEWRAGLGKPKNFLASVDAGQINKIEIIQKEKTVVLEKQGDKWKIGGAKDFYVRQSLAENLNKVLKEGAEAEMELASANKEKKGEFQTDESGINVKLYQSGDIAADFIVGKRAADFATVYVSRPESDNTYSIKADLYGVFGRSDWHDKSIFSSDKEKINKIRFQYSDREFTVEKTAADGADAWEGTIPYKFSVNKDKIDKILDLMSNLIATEIPEQKFEGTGLEKHLMVIQASGEGIENTIMVGNDNGEELYYAKRGDSDNIYLITKEQRDALDKRIGDLK